MRKTIQIIGPIFISITLLFGQSDSSTGTSRQKPEFAVNDTTGHLQIPARSADAMEGSEFARQIAGLSLVDREKAVIREVLSGNVPTFSRSLRPLKISHTIDGESHELIFFTVCDYLAIGSDDDYLYIPLTPSTAQYLADTLHCLLPTKKLVDIIYTDAEIQLKPQPIPPSDQMTTVPVFLQHTDSIKLQILKLGFDRSEDQILAGHKKDIIISNKIYSADRNFDRVVIYGWHRNENNPIQPVYNGHTAKYADYSHGIRLISRMAFLSGEIIQMNDVLQDSVSSGLVSDEGVIRQPYYPQNDTSSDFMPSK